MTMQEDRYKFVTAQQNYLNEKILETFSQFVTIISTIAGGVIWLRAQNSWPSVWPQAKEIAIALVLLLGTQALLRIWINAKSWWGFRRAESLLTQGEVPEPTFPRSAIQELIFTLVIAATTFGALCLLWKLQ